MAKVLCYTVTRASTPQRALLLTNTLTDARRTSGHPFTWVVFTNGSSLADGVIESAVATRLVDEHRQYSHNVGQHPPTNAAIALARKGGYDYLLRLDDDLEFPTKRWLAKLLDAMAKLEDKFILSPTIKGLKNQPLLTPPVEVAGMEMRFVPQEGGIGGICRLHPVKLFCHEETGYVSDVRMPMGAGDATGVMKWAAKHDPIVPVAWLGHVRVKHAHGTLGQEKRDPAHFKSHKVLQHVPYIPPYVEG